MIQRYDKKKLQSIIKRKIIIGSILVLLGAICFILIEMIDSLNNIYTQIAVTLLVLTGIIIAALVGIEFRKIEEENKYLALEKYIDETDECNKHIRILYKMFLNGTLIEELNKMGIDVLNVFPYEMNESIELEFVDKDHKLVMIFYEEVISYSTIKLDKYIFDDDTVIKEILDFTLNSEEDILALIQEIYNEFLNRQK